MWHSGSMNGKTVKGGGAKKQRSATSLSSTLGNSVAGAHTVPLKAQPEPKSLVATIYKRSALVEQLLSSKNSKFTTVTPVLHGRQAEAVRAAVLKQLEEDKDQ